MMIVEDLSDNVRPFPFEGSSFGLHQVPIDERDRHMQRGARPFATAQKHSRRFTATLKGFPRPLHGLENAKASLIGSRRAGVVELVDAPDSKSGSERSVGSIPTARTKLFNARAADAAGNDRSHRRCRVLSDKSRRRAFCEICRTASDCSGWSRRIIWCGRRRSLEPGNGASIGRGQVVRHHLISHLATAHLHMSF